MAIQFKLEARQMSISCANFFYTNYFQSLCFRFSLHELKKEEKLFEV